MGLGNNAKKCTFGDNDLADDGVGGADCDSRDGDDGFDSVACSICLETVANHVDRSWAKLQCGHEFHLDCIGSAFNAKGMMQCPNCRKIEKGQWLYANGCRPFPDDWPREEDMYDPPYSEMSFGVWCPFGSIGRLPSFEDAEFSPSSYDDLLSQHGFFTEPAASSAGHPCPYIAYFGPLSNSAAPGVSDSSNFSSHWNSASSAGEVPVSYGFAALDPRYHGWDYHSPPFSGPGTHIGRPPLPTAPRTARASLDLLRPRPPHYMRPLISHSVDGRSVAAAQRAPGSSARTRDRVHALQAYYQQSHLIDLPVYPSGRRRGISSGMGSTSTGTATASSPDQTGGFIRFNVWERDRFLQINGDSSYRWTTAFLEGFHHRYGGGFS
ncbi:PREDICTED: uncharacterized protein LOC104821725 isoform X2 [Tarenaya hassleriana]|uniref:uncharacterized protein LOC104821725 isoform X2 n=1 Tax=Tarenaya hassleriana TaxID=28532 RepID=UPI00053C3CA8|nr:PREDICTED: uncharacterized protein LOC104821725 isoform X2 [Tarenaya hassleriana]